MWCNKNEQHHTLVICYSMAIHGGGAEVFILIIESLFPSKEISNFCFYKSAHLETISPALINICLRFLWEIPITALINKDNSGWY